MSEKRVELLLRDIQDIVYRNFEKGLEGNLSLIERCIRNFEAAATELKYRREEIIEGVKNFV